MKEGKMIICDICNQSDNKKTPANKVFLMVTGLDQVKPGGMRPVLFKEHYLADLCKFHQSEMQTAIKNVVLSYTGIKHDER